jgi:hypothetical protein
MRRVKEILRVDRSKEAVEPNRRDLSPYRATRGFVVFMKRWVVLRCDCTIRRIISEN